jgi:hypothetical protein
MDYTGNDQQYVRTKEVNEFQRKIRNKDRKLKNELKRATGKAKKECLESTFDKTTELKKKKKKLYDLMHVKKQEISWKENHWIRIINIEDFQGNKIIDQ